MPIHDLSALLPMLAWHLHPGGFLQAWLLPGEMRVHIYSSELHKGPTRLIERHPYRSNVQVVAGTLTDHRFRQSVQIGAAHHQLAVMPTGDLEKRASVRLVSSDAEMRTAPQIFGIPSGALHWLESSWGVTVCSIDTIRDELPLIYIDADADVSNVASPQSPLLWTPLIHRASQELLELYR